MQNLFHTMQYHTMQILHICIILDCQEVCRASVVSCGGDVYKWLVVSPAVSYQDEYSVQPVALSGFDKLDTDWFVKSCFTDDKITELFPG